MNDKELINNEITLRNQLVPMAWDFLQLKLNPLSGQDFNRLFLFIQYFLKGTVFTFLKIRKILFFSITTIPLNSYINQVC